MVCLKSPELFKPIARQRTKWPGFISHDVNIALDNEYLAKKLNLGVAAKAAKKKLPESKDEQID